MSCRNVSPHQLCDGVWTSVLGAWDCDLVCLRTKVSEGCSRWLAANTLLWFIHCPEASLDSPSQHAPRGPHRAVVMFPFEGHLVQYSTVAVMWKSLLGWASSSVHRSNLVISISNQTVSCGVSLVPVRSEERSEFMLQMEVDGFLLVKRCSIAATVHATVSWWWPLRESSFTTR